MATVIKLTLEEGERWRKFVKKSKEKSKKRIDEIFEKVPKIHWEILKFANHHTKEECLAAYPDHEEFINKIIFGTPLP